MPSVIRIVSLGVASLCGITLILADGLESLVLIRGAYERTAYANEYGVVRQVRLSLVPNNFDSRCYARNQV